MKIIQFPLARITICFVLGILVAHFFNLTPILTFGLLFISTTFLIACFFLSKKNLSAKLFFGVSVAIVAFQVGVTTQIIHNESLNKNHYTRQISNFEKDHDITLVLKEKLKNTVLNQRYIAEIKTLNGKTSFGKIILNIRKSNNEQDFKIGTNLKFRNSIYKNRGPVNPNQFNYGRYLENQQIYGQIYISINQIKKGNIEHSIWSSVANLRTKIIKNLEEANFPKEELSIVIALILGQQQDISPEVLKDYQYAGAVHVLSVSGLHVGFILMFISFLLKPIPNSKLGSNTKVIIIIVSLWLFGILAGLAPSVLRSVTMFSFVALGMHLRRTVNIYHTLLVSMLLILLFKPSFLFDVGFQLSYVALFFIVWFQPLLASTWQPKYKIVNYFWDIITVSFAAQIGAFPLSVYYFHQFPGLFFITNIVIIPMLSIILAIGVLVVIFAAFNYVPFYLAKTLEYSIIILNKIIHWVASFESFIFRDISFNFQMLICCYLIIITSIIWFKKPNLKKLSVALFAVISLQSIYLYNEYSTKTQEECFVFNIKKNTVITERKGTKVTVYSTDSILENIDNNLTVKSYLVGNFCKISAKKPLRNLLYFGHKKVLLLDSSSVYSPNLKPDIIIIIQSPKVNLERLLQTLKPKQVIIDGSNFKTYVKRWEATCQKQKIPFHNTNEKGFYKF